MDKKHIIFTILANFFAIIMGGCIDIAFETNVDKGTSIDGAETAQQTNVFQPSTVEAETVTPTAITTATRQLNPQDLTDPALLTPDSLTPDDYGPLLYEEDFERDTGRWALDKGCYIENGELVIAPGMSARPSLDAQNFSDFIFETEFRFLDHSKSIFSVYLRFSNLPCSGPTQNCFDQVVVLSNGYIGAYRSNGNSASQVLASTGVSQLSSTKLNTLTVFVNGDEFRIFVNGKFVRSFIDSRYKSGIFVLDADNAATAFNYVRVFGLP